jgi:hypothetical protein
MMGIWRRWLNKWELEADVGSASTTKHGEAHLRNELRQLAQQRQAIEQRGCFSDRELEAKDRELENLDSRIKVLKSQQFRLRTQGKIRL